MPVDKLVLLSKFIKGEFLMFARSKGKPGLAYNRQVDLRESPWKLPVYLHCEGRFNGRHKIQFIDVAHLGKALVEKVACELLGSLETGRIYRIDFCVDILGFSAQELAEACLVHRAHNFRIYRSHDGDSYYPKYSPERKVLLYDRLRWLRAKHHPLAALFSEKDKVARIEVQLSGRGVIFRELYRLNRYAYVNLLRDIEWLKMRPIKTDGIRPIRQLAAERLQSAIKERGLQATSRQFPSSHWAYLKKTLLRDDVDQLPNFGALMSRSVRDWIDNRLRFPRGATSVTDQKGTS